jgi:hypothetical protein
VLHANGGDEMVSEKEDNREDETEGTEDKTEYETGEEESDDEEEKARARTTDPETSHVAARSVRNIKGKQKQILELFKKYGPMAEDEMQRRADEEGLWPCDSGRRARRSNLVDKGYLRDSGKREKTKHGRPSIIWEVFDPE